VCIVSVYACSWYRLESCIGTLVRQYPHSSPQRFVPIPARPGKNSSITAGTDTGLHLTVMWSETVGLRTRPVWDQKKLVFILVLHAVVLVLVLQVWCCVVKHGLVSLVVIMILKDTATFQLLFIVYLFCAWNITAVEIT